MRKHYTVHCGVSGYSNYDQSFSFVGSQREVIMEAQERAEMIVLQIIRKEKIYNNADQDELMGNVFYTYTEYKEPLTMFAVLDTSSAEPSCLGVFASAADAFEMLYTYAEEWVYELACTADFDEVGLNPFKFRDYWKLMKDFCNTYIITEVPVFGVTKEEE